MFYIMIRDLVILAAASAVLLGGLCVLARWIASPKAEGRRRAGVELESSRGTAADDLADQASPAYRVWFATEEAAD